MGGQRERLSGAKGYTVYSAQRRKAFANRWVRAHRNARTQSATAAEHKVACTNHLKGRLTAELLINGCTNQSELFSAPRARVRCALQPPLDEMQRQLHSATRQPRAIVTRAAMQQRLDRDSGGPSDYTLQSVRLCRTLHYCCISLHSCCISLLLIAISASVPQRHEHRQPILRSIGADIRSVFGARRVDRPRSIYSSARGQTSGRQVALPERHRNPLTESTTAMAVPIGIASMQMPQTARAQCKQNVDTPCAGGARARPRP